MFLPRNLGPALRRATAALLSPSRPILVQLVVTRRCNLVCGYCDEYDDGASHIGTDLLFDRIDHAADLGTIVTTLTGGEPLLHPDFDRLVARADGRGMVCTAITNGTALTRRRIERLNDAGLAFLQVSVDALEPTAQSQKSWARLRRPVALLREHARFGVNVNAVLGSCEPAALRALAAEVRGAGFYMTVGVMHGEDGCLIPGLAGEDRARLFEDVQRHSRKTILHRSGEGWESRLLRNGTAPFKCRAGARYLYVDETGVASYCSQQRGRPGTAFLDMEPRHLAREFRTAKGCEAACAIGCARRASAFDGWRGQPD